MKNKHETREILARNIDKIDIPDRWREMMEFRFGGLTIKTLQETGDKFGVTRERVRQVESMVLDRINQLTKSQ